MKVACGLVPLILPISLSLCDHDSCVEVVNESDEAVETMTIAVSGSRVEMRDLAVSDARRWMYRPERDSCFEVRAHFISGAIIEATCVGYTTPNEGISHRVTLRRDGTVRYEAID